jgi:xylulose-5-phosphate/fructose-6-phosphate phosphoketolase
MADVRLAARRYTREHGEDDPAISEWTWESGFRPSGQQSMAQDTADNE